MRIAHLKIYNYRGLRELSIPMSNFGCLIGENNVGKSSILQALSLFFSGSSLSKQNFYNDGEDIRIEIKFSDITESDLSRLVEEHKQKIKEIVHDGHLTLLRRYGLDGKSQQLKYLKLMPKDKRFDSNAIDNLVKGKRPGASFVSAVQETFPEISDEITVKMNQTEMKEMIYKLADRLPDNEKQLTDIDLPTGIDRSITPMLPEPIYIPAVKDLADDTKTKESTPFGKILSILLKAIEGKLTSEKQLFEELHGKLNRVIMPDGSIKDERLDEVKLIESTVESYVQESFPNVTLKIDIPPPEIKTILSGAQILANDGVEGLIDSKGDGLRRAIVFSILRSYVELNKSAKFHASVSIENQQSFLLLFEEPELYLHPKAQQILFDVLNTFSKQHHVIVTTHSPIFFGPNATATFVKLVKKPASLIAKKPFAVAFPVDLTEVNSKDQFQIICYENNNIAFFSDTVVLVEGDSDYIVFPHVARVIDRRWDCSKTPVTFSRINGKSSIRRYKKFFSRFEIRVAVISDLDLLIKDFDQIDPIGDLKQQRNLLIQKLDKIITSNRLELDITERQAGEAQKSGTLRRLWKTAEHLHKKFERGETSFTEVCSAVEEFFAWERNRVRLDILKKSEDQELFKMKRKLLSDLREHDIYILERGNLEDYYPETIPSLDKPSRAQYFCNTLAEKDAVLSLCSEVTTTGTGKKEFEVIFEKIFESSGVIIPSGIS